MFIAYSYTSACKKNDPLWEDVRANEDGIDMCIERRVFSMYVHGFFFILIFTEIQSVKKDMFISTNKSIGKRNVNINTLDPWS